MDKVADDFSRRRRTYAVDGRSASQLKREFVIMQAPMLPFTFEDPSCLGPDFAGRFRFSVKL
jgi:hypothetical protein